MASSKRSIAAKKTWQAIPWPYKAGGAAVATFVIWRVVRKRDKPPRLPRIRATYVDPKLIGTGLQTMWSPTPLASELYQSMKPTNWGMIVGIGGDNEKAWKKLFQISDSSKIVAVYNEYNKIAKANKDPLSLTQKVRDESGSLYGSWKPELLIKLDTLGLL